MNRAASTLGKLAKGIPKNFSPEQLAIRKQRLAEARAKRWPKIWRKTLAEKREENKAQTKL